MVGVVRYYDPCERSVNTKFDAVLRVLKYTKEHDET